MTRVDFYVLNEADEDRREAYLCRVVDKAYRLGHRVWLHVPAEARAAALDERLWTFSQQSFLPHERIADDDGSSPVVIGDGREPGDDYGLLINEDAEVPPFFARFGRVAEFVDQSADTRRRGRANYAYYREQGCELHVHRFD